MHGCPIDSQPANAAVGIYVQSDMTKPGANTIQKIACEDVCSVSLEGDGRENCLPIAVRWLDVEIWRIYALQTAAVGVVPSEVTGVNDDFTNVSTSTEFNDAPVMILVSASLRLPTIPHMSRSIGHQQVRRGAKKLV